MTDFQVSVIIPVYNAENFVEEAVESVHDLEEVREIILIEDGSKDGSLELCKKIVEKYYKCILLTHLNNENKGASESRNLGIINSKCSYLSFLDADDIYLPNRFSKAAKLFDENPTIDGVYCCCNFLNEANGKNFQLIAEVAPNKLYHYLIRGTYGHFHTNGITVKKTIFDKTGLFNTKLKLHQDSEMWFRMALEGRLIRGEYKTPVASIRRHESNRIWSGKNNQTQILLYKEHIKSLKGRKVSILNYLLLYLKLSKLESKEIKQPVLRLLLQNLFNNRIDLKK